MRSIIAFVIVAAALAALGVASLGVARLEGHMADAQERLATLQYDAAKESLTAAGEYADHARWVPVLGRDERQEIRARAAAVQYWQKQYDTVVPAQAEPVAAVGDDNVELQLVVANAAYRLGQGRSKDKTSTMKALEEAASGYLTVLKNNTWHADAAFNYEYIVHLRNELAKGKQPPQPPKDQSEDADNGESGAPSPATNSKGFQIYIPLEQGEKNPAGGDAGKAAPKERKG
jgi:type II secretory pathway pseudopilin PulG